MSNIQQSKATKKILGVQIWTKWVLKCIRWTNVSLPVEVKLKKKFLGAQNWTQKLGFLPFSQVGIFSFPWYCTRLELGTMSNIYSRTEGSKKKYLWSKLGPTRPKPGLKWGLALFSSYFIKRGKILLKWYFLSVDYMEFLLSITPILLSLGIE